MKILLVAKKFGYSGGTEKYVVNFIKDFSSLGHEVFLLYAEDSIEKSPEASGLLEGSYRLPSLYKFPENSTSEDEKEAEGVVLDINPDVIYMRDVLNYRFIEIFLKLKPTLAMEHSLTLFCVGGSKVSYFARNICRRKINYGCFFCGCFLGGHLERKFIKKWSSLYHAKKRMEVYKKIPCILVASQFMKKLFLENGFDEDRIFVIPHYVDIPDESRIEYPQTGSKILFVGRVDRYKGLDFLIRALPLIRADVKVIVAGRETLRKGMERLAGKLGVSEKIEFKGWIDSAAINELYRQASVVVVPSIWPEPFGRVGTEAFSYGRPVVAFDVGGISQWLQDGKTGFLVPPKDVKELARKIEKLILDKELAARMGKAGRKCIQEKFNRKENLSNLRQHINEIAFGNKIGIDD